MMARLKPAVTTVDHQRGPADAPVTLVEYGDFQCPYCGRAFGILEQVTERLGDSMRLVFRNFPLTEVHESAEQAAEAAEAAASRGKFWEMHDLLFRHQNDGADPLGLASLGRYAALLGFSAQEVVDEVESHRFLEHVREDFMSGVRSGVNGTPTFFINGERYDGPVEVESLVAALEHALSD
jgi:protein-disulfide isomerase